MPVLVPRAEIAAQARPEVWPGRSRAGPDSGRAFLGRARASPSGSAQLANYSVNAAASVVLSGTGDPRVARNPSGHGFGQKIMPVTGRGFLNGVIFC